MNVVRLTLLLAVLPVVTACSSDLDQLQAWTEAERRNAKPSVQALVPPKKFLPQPYDALDGVEPFSTQKLSVASKQEAAQPNSMLAAEMNRRRCEQEHAITNLTEIAEKIGSLSPRIAAMVRLIENHEIHMAQFGTQHVS